MFEVGRVVLQFHQFSGLSLSGMHPATTSLLLLVVCCGYFSTNPFDLCTVPVYTVHFLSHDRIYTFDGYI